MAESVWQVVEHADLVDAKIYSCTVQEHRVDVYVPDDVVATSPILVMHDGKNVFWPEHSSEGDTWGVIDAVQCLQVRPVVIAVWGLVSPLGPLMRDYELSPQALLTAHPELWGSMRDRANASDDSLLGAAYQDLIAEVLIPEVAGVFALNLDPSRTALCGSSLGGIASLYGAARYPHTYGAVLSLSTHWAFWNPGIVQALLSELSVDPRPRIWLDRGTLDLDALYEGLHEHAVEFLLERGWAMDFDLHGAVFAGTNHSEQAWRERFPEVLSWWLAGLNGVSDGGMSY